MEKILGFRNLPEKLENQFLLLLFYFRMSPYNKTNDLMLMQAACSILEDPGIILASLLDRLNLTVFNFFKFFNCLKNLKKIIFLKNFLQNFSGLGNISCWRFSSAWRVLWAGRWISTSYYCHSLRTYVHWCLRGTF